MERDRYRCTVKGCGKTVRHGRLYVDHIEPRPYSPYPTKADVLDNLRTLCSVHDNQIRQDRTGKRRRDGKTVVLGCDADGVPLDPGHLWNR